MVVTSQEPGFTSSAIKSVWGVSRQVLGASPNDQTGSESSGPTSVTGSGGPTSGTALRLPGWRVRRFAAQAGLTAILAALALTPNVSHAMAPSPTITRRGNHVNLSG